MPIVTAAKTHIQAQRDQVASIQHQVMSRLQCSEFNYCNRMFLTGLDYLEWIMPSDPDSARLISYQRVYWGWWRNHWMDRDENFLDNNGDGTKLHQRRKFYRELHDAETLANEVTGFGVILGDSYSRMIKDLWTGIKAQECAEFAR